MDINGVLVALSLLLNTVIAAYSVSQNKLYKNAYRWRKRIEPIHLDSLDWMYEVQTTAKKKGWKDLPPLPKSVRNGWIEDEELNSDLTYLKQQVERRRERD